MRQDQPDLVPLQMANEVPLDRLTKFRGAGLRYSGPGCTRWGPFKLTDPFRELLGAALTQQADPQVEQLTHPIEPGIFRNCNEPNL